MPPDSHELLSESLWKETARKEQVISGPGDSAFSWGYLPLLAWSPAANTGEGPWPAPPTATFLVSIGGLATL